MTTPEGKIKRKVTDVLRKNNIYYFMPVQSGFGGVTLDYLCCVSGKFLAIETKAPGKNPTDRQKTIIEDIENSGGMVFVIRDELDVANLEKYIIGRIYG